MKLSLVVVLMVTLIAGVAIQPANAAVTQVKQHVFAQGINKSGRNWTPINVTNTFTQDDAYVYAFTDASFSQTNFTWVWYDPGGALYQTHSENWGCGGISCQFYDGLAVAGTDAATKFGTWRMDLLADGKLLYSDKFTIAAVIHEDFNWTINIYRNDTVAVELDETVHPLGQQWTERGFDTDSSLGLTNFAAHDSRGRTLLVTVKTTGSRIAFTVLFPETETSDYAYTLTYNVLSAVSAASNGQKVLGWGWCTGVYPLPQNVTVYLPQNYELVEVQNVPTNTVQTSTMNGDQVVKFSGVAPSGNPGCFNWRLVYAMSTARTQFYLTVTSPFGQSQGQGQYNQGDTATFSVSPTRIRGVEPFVDAVFVGWTGASTSNEATATVIMDSNKTVTAVWVYDYGGVYFISMIVGLAAAVCLALVIVRRRRRRKKEKPELGNANAAFDASKSGSSQT